MGLLKLLRRIKAENELRKQWFVLFEICQKNSCNNCWLYDKEAFICRGYQVLNDKRAVLDKEYHKHAQRK